MKLPKFIMLFVVIMILISASVAIAADPTGTCNGSPQGTVRVPGNEWTKEDTIKEATFVGLLFLEKAQRNYVTEHGGRYIPNPFLGPNRKQSDMDKFLVASAILHPLISYFLPRQYRDWWQYGTLIIEGTSIASNMSFGVGFNF